MHGAYGRRDRIINQEMKEVSYGRGVLGMGGDGEMQRRGGTSFRIGAGDR